MNKDREFYRKGSQRVTPFLGLSTPTGQWEPPVFSLNGITSLSPVSVRDPSGEDLLGFGEPGFEVWCHPFLAKWWERTPVWVWAWSSTNKLCALGHVAFLSWS